MADYLILGAGGQLGQAFLAELGGRAVALGHGEAELGDAAGLEAVLRRHRPGVVINAAAYNHVDLAESHRQQALAANFAGPATLAGLAAGLDYRLLHFSTDYVFGADGIARPRIETDAPAPVNFYGYTKWLGEQAALQAGGERALVARVAHLYGGVSLAAGRGNLVERFLELAAAGRPILATEGQRLNPTAVVDIVAASLRLLQRGASGLYHLTGEGECTVAEFAGAVLELAGAETEIRAVSQDARPAARAHNTVLENRRLAAEGFPPMPHWHTSLTTWFRQRGRKNINCNGRETHHSHGNRTR